MLQLAGVLWRAPRRTLERGTDLLRLISANIYQLKIGERKTVFVANICGIGDGNVLWAIALPRSARLLR